MLPALRRLLLLGLLLGSSLTPAAAIAHDVAASRVWLDIGWHRVGVDLRLPVSELAAATGLSLGADPASAVTAASGPIRAYVAAHVRLRALDGRLFDASVGEPSAALAEGRAWVDLHIDFSAPPGATDASFTLVDDLIIEQVANHVALVSVRHDFRNGLLGNDELAVGALQYQQTELTLDGRRGGGWVGLRAAVRLGLKHVVAGADHLLFVALLVLVAPLSARSGRWHQGLSARSGVRRAARLATGFTLGHTAALAAVSLGWLLLPARPIEVLVAATILISAIHAWRPLFAGHELRVAAAFGLVHGMAFAEALEGLSIDLPALLLTLLGFNLGVELMQLAVVAALLPPLLAMRAQPGATLFRRTAALACGALALLWIAVRALALPDPSDGLGAWLGENAAYLIAALALLAAALRYLGMGQRSRRALSVARTPG